MYNNHNNSKATMRHYQNHEWLQKNYPQAFNALPGKNKNKDADIQFWLDGRELFCCPKSKPGDWKTWFDREANVWY